MKVIGIIAEYNPFHNGHKYQIEYIKEKYPDSIIVVCMSSSFTQRGDISILNKFDKTKIAMMNGVDLIVELPYVYTTQSGDIFAKYGVKILKELKIDMLCFGTETNNIDEITNNANIQLKNKKFDPKVKEYLDTGVNYPTALNNALKDLGGTCINKPNDLLALSYVKEIISNNYKIDLFNIKRTNDYHDLESNDKIVSASNIRNKLLNKLDFKKQVSDEVYDILKNKQFNNKYFEYLKYKIISEDVNSIDKYLDVDEGLAIRIKNVIDESNSLEELIQNIKTKRYTYNKISRMLNHILCSYTVKEKKETNKLEYIRVLGFSVNGQKYLNKIKNDIKVPILNKYDTKTYKALEIEKRVTDIYSLIYEDISKEEIKNKPYKNTD